MSQMPISLTNIESLNNHGHLMLDLNVEWRPSFSSFHNPVANFQLYVSHRCPIYQLIHSSYIPDHLVEFLSEQDYTFVGVGIDYDLGKFERDYRFGFNANVVDLRELAADAYQMRELRNTGLKNLARFVLDKEFEKPRRASMSRWDYRWLMPDQLQYACVDAYFSFEIGRVLNGAR